MEHTIFKREEEVLDQARRALEGPLPQGEEGERRYRDLLAAYETILTTSKRLLRLSDRNTGFRLDLDELSDASRRDAIRSLEQALVRLRGEAEG